MRPVPTRSPARLAFTLIELLVVITVISLLLAFSAPALFNGLQASRLSGAGERMVSALSEAQQTAFSQNTAIEVQFYSYPGEFGSEAQFRAYRMFKITNPANANAAQGPTESVVSTGSIVKLPDGVIISQDQGLSPGLSTSMLSDDKEYAGVTGARYAAIRFLPDGTCRQVASTGTGLAVMQFLSLRDSFFTMLEDDGEQHNGVNLPKNFYTIQIDPYTGKARSYRPGF